MKLGSLYTNQLDQILDLLKIKKLSINLIKSRICKKFDVNQQDKIMKQLNDEFYLNRYTRQYGKPFRIKKRKLDIRRYYKIKKQYDKEHYYYDHHCLFFDNQGLVYHFTPLGIKQGKEEYNKEISSYDFEGDNKKPFYTFVSEEEIDNFIKKFSKYYKYRLGLNNSELFVNLLAYYLI